MSGGWTSSRESMELRNAFWRERVQAETEARRDELGDIVRRSKERPCTDCKVQYPHYVMQHDHLVAEKKLFNIAQWGDLLPSKERLVEEIAKCEIVCANCHAERTWQRDKGMRERRAKADEKRREQARAKAAKLGVPAVPYKTGRPDRDRR